MLELCIKTAEVFEPLLYPHRYKGAYGGRGSGKSHFFAELLLDYALFAKEHFGEGLRAVCIREVQKSIKQSSRQLIVDKLEKYNLGSDQGFKVFNDRIELPDNGIIIFQGMQDHTADSIKSLEGFHVAWIEEAQTISEYSLQLLRPTIRKDKSEIWASWNPRRKSDPIDVMFREHTLADSVCVRANYSENPWYPKVLEQERIDCQSNDTDNYSHIWEGDYIVSHKGAYYASKLSDAEKEGRIDKLGPDPYMIHRAFIDIGGTGAKSDAFTIWIAQFVGKHIKVLNYYEVVGQDLSHHLDWLRSYDYNTKNTKIWLPHDGATNDKVYNVSYESAFTSAGYQVEVVPNQGKGAAKARIEALRRILPICWFDKDKTSSGIEALRWYHEKWDEDRNIGLGPNHDWSSHGADSAGLMAVCYESRTETNNKELPLPKLNIA